jgi:hypothetical protein
LTGALWPSGEARQCWEASVGSQRSARRQERAREFGRRHPRLTLVISCVLLGGIIAICAVQLRHGAYLGRGWLIAAVAGTATEAAVSAAALISRLRPSPATPRIQMTWLVLGLLSASAIAYPFPEGPYGGVQAFFNVAHAALLGGEAVTCATIIVLLAYAIVRRRPPVPAARRHGLPDDTGQLPGRQMPKARAWPGWVLTGAAAGLVAGFILAAVGAPDPHDAASTAGTSLVLIALAAACLAGSAALYRRYRSRRVAAVPPSLPGTGTADHLAGQD